MSSSTFPQQTAGQTSESHHQQSQHDQHYENMKSKLECMRQLEVTTYKRPLARHLPVPFNGLWRQQIVEWMYTLVKYCNLRHESATAASYYLDVAVSKGLVQSPNDYQLGAMAALYLGLKVYDSPCMRVIKLSSLVKLGNGEFTEGDILLMERELVKLLDWHLNPPTPGCFVQQYLTLLPQRFHGEESSSNHKIIRDRIEEIALEAIEVVVARDYFLPIPPSVLGYSVMLFAIESLDSFDQQQQHQKHVHPQQRMHLSFLELQTFVWRMEEMTTLQTNNPCLMRASMLLDLTTKNLPIPASCRNEGGGGFLDQQLNDVIRKRRVKESSFSTRGNVACVDVTLLACEGDYSPNYVMMQ